MADFLSEGGHWYKADGSPCYEIEKAKGGGLRPTTLRDAKKLNLKPSVTGIIKEMAAPALTQWKMREALKLVYGGMYPMYIEEENQFVARVMEAQEKPVKEKAKLGGDIHWALEQSFEGEEYNPNYQPHVDAVHAYIKTLGDYKWVAEQSFATGGYGGKVDLHCPEIVVDFKTKEFTQDKLPKCYENHWMQLASYRVGLGHPLSRGIIIFVSINEPGLIHPVECSSKELVKGFRMFKSLFDLWCTRRDYIPDA